MKSQNLQKEEGHGKCITRQGDPVSDADSGLLMHICKDVSVGVASHSERKPREGNVRDEGGWNAGKGT